MLRILTVSAAVLALGVAAAQASEYEVRIASGHDSLAATLRIPDGVSGPVPAVVIVHGSGKATRAQIRVLGDRALSSGMAALTYDKRGVGESGGRYRDVNAKSSVEAFDELVGDLLALGRWLTSSASTSSAQPRSSRVRPPSPRSCRTPPSQNTGPNTLAARSSRRSSGPSAWRRVCTMATTVPGSSSMRPSATARISSSR